MNEKDPGRFYKVPVDSRFMSLLWKKRVVQGGRPIAELVTEALEAYLQVKLEPASTVDKAWTPRASPNRKPVPEEAAR